MLYVTSTIGRPQNGQPSDVPKKEIQITKFHVNTDIQMRYAVTKVTVQMKNPDSDSQEAVFDMYIPEDAFVSNFSMKIKDKTYVAKVETKEKAKTIFENSGSNAGLVQNRERSDFKETNHIAFSAKVDAFDKVVFELTYEQPLDRVNGLNNYKLHLNLKDQVIDDFKIKVNITETLPIKRESFEVRRESNDIDLMTEDLEDTISFGDENTAPNNVVVEYVPSINEQNEGQDWQFNVDYDVIRPEDGNDVQIGAGRFVHYFSPEDLPTLIKHVIFVIDVSGSMGGTKIKQTQDAMLWIVDHLDSQDSFDIITFSDDAKIWSPTEESTKKCPGNNRLTTECLKSEAQKKIFDLEAGGGTNINAAVLNATKLAKSISKNATFEDVKQTMIIFLTDGEATSGITNNQEIKSNIKKSNEGQMPIYGLAFGNGADFDLIKDISTESGAFTKRIYESGNSFEQLENYYKEISDPKLRNVTFQYIANGKEIPAKLVIGTRIQNAYGKNEYVVTGEFEDPEIILEEFEIITIGEGANGVYTKRSSIDLCELAIDPCFNPLNPCCVSHPPVTDIPNLPELPSPRFISAKWEQTPAESFLERLWAFKRIKFLLNDDVDCEKGIHEEPECFAWNDKLWEGIEPVNAVETECGLESCIVCGELECSEEAVNLAKKYNFVTKATSLVVESDDDYIKNGTINFDATIFRPPYEYDYDYDLSFSSLSSANYGNRRYAGYATPSNIGLQSSGGSALNCPNCMINPDYASYDYGYAATTRPLSFQTTTYYYTTTTTPYTQCKLTLYSLTHFRGESVEIDSNVTSLASLNFDDKVASVDVEGNCCWKIFVDDNFTGDSMQLRRQEYRSAVDIQRIYQQASSVQILNQCS